MSDWTRAGATGEPSDDDAATRDWVLETAAAFVAGEIDHFEVRRRCTGWDRWVAVRFTALDDPLRPALLAMLDALIASDPTQRDGWTYTTRQGMFGEAELRSVQAEMFAGPEGQVGIRFPVRYGVLGPEFKGQAA